MTQTTDFAFLVPDMSCGHCVRAITDAVHAVAPGAAVAVDLDARQVRVQGAPDAAAVAAAIAGEGYAPALL